MNLVILVLPLGGIWALRLYESALLRQTESELIAQAAFVAADYRAALRTECERSRTGICATLAESAPSAVSGEIRPRSAVLDLAVDFVRPRAPAPLPAAGPADPAAAAAGRAIEPVLREAQRVTLAAIRVADPAGVVVASSAGEIGRSLAHHEDLARALRGEEVSLLRERVSDEPPPALSSLSRGSRVRIFVGMPIAEGDRILGAAVLSRTPRTIGQALYGKRGPIAVSVVALLGVVLLLSLFTAVAIVRPVRALIEQTERAARGERGAVAPLERPVTREIAQLSDTVATMARSLEQRSDTIRTFASHVSHEFKTPLTAIRGAMELLRDHTDTMSAVERRRFVENVLGDTARLEQLVRRLLDLARADATEPAGETANVPGVLGRIAERYRREGMTVEVDVEPEAGAAAIAEDALESVLSNLVDNTKQHGGEDARVSIRAVGAGSTNGRRVRIVVADDGRGITSGNAARIFDPFFTTARREGGTGLGLAVAKSLVNAYGGSISLVPAVRGATFEIVLRGGH